MWSTQRSVEKMNDRVLQLQHELDEASEASQSLSPFLLNVANIVYAVSVIVPNTLFIILNLLFIVLFSLTVDNLEDSSSPLTNPYFYLNPYFLVLALIAGMLFLSWRVFYSKPFKKAVRSLRNAVEYDSFKIEAEKAIAHLEGKIKRLEK